MMRILLLCMLLLGMQPPSLAQVTDTLPATPVYKGEIRRGPDGKLIVLESKPADDTPSTSHNSNVSTPINAQARTRHSTSNNSNATTIPHQTTILRVGPQEKITTITEAAKLARDGDVIEISPGDYRGQPAIWTQKNLVIRGIAQRPVMIADGKSAEGKAIWVIRGGTIRIENIEFRGARVPDGNGAGIRFERGNLVVHRCAFFDNEMGLLTANFPDMSLEISDSEFGSAPRHPGHLHHLLYVGSIDRLVLTGSRFENGYRGHLVKSRARESHVSYNLIADSSEGKSSYELEFSNGGIAYVIGNLIGQSAGTENPTLISYGAEGSRWPENALYVAHNTLLNDYHGGIYLKVWNEKFPSAIDTWVVNNLTVGNGDLFPPANGRFEGNHAVQRRDLLIYGGLPLRLKVDASLRGKARIPGEVRGKNLLPAAEFVYPAGTRRIEARNSLAPGALQ